MQRGVWSSSMTERATEKWRGGRVSKQTSNDLERSIYIFLHKVLNERVNKICHSNYSGYHAGRITSIPIKMLTNRAVACTDRAKMNEWMYEWINKMWWLWLHLPPICNLHYGKLFCLVFWELKVSKGRHCSNKADQMRVVLTMHKICWIFMLWS